MNTDFLKNLGLDNEQVKKIMAEHGKSVNALKEENTALNSERDNLKDQLADVKNNLADVQKQAEKDSQAQATIEQLHEKLAQSENKFKEELQATKTNHAIERELSSFGAKNIKAVKALLDLDNVKFEDNKLNGLQDQLNKIKETEPYLLNGSEETKAHPQIQTQGNPNPEHTRSNENNTNLSLTERLANTIKNNLNNKGDK